MIEAAGIGDLSNYNLGELSDRDRANALPAAAVNERLDTIDQLLGVGTPVDAQTDGHPAIYWAHQQGRAKAVAHLIANGAKL